MELKNRRHSFSEGNQVWGQLIIEVLMKLDGSNLTLVFSRSKGPESQNLSLRKKTEGDELGTQGEEIPEHGESRTSP